MRYNGIKSNPTICKEVTSMSKLILGTHHIALKADSVELFEETVRFYHEILGMPFIRSWNQGERIGAMLDTGNSIMEISAGGDDMKQSGSIRHFALATDDVDAVVEIVRKAGYPITMEPKDGALPTEPPFPIRIAFCVGPCGEEVEFFCEKEK